MQRPLAAVVEVPRLMSKTEEVSPLRSFRPRGDLEDYQPSIKQASSLGHLEYGW